jgi:hypothetical protein
MHGLSTRKAARKRTFAPTLEALEDRSLPTVLAPVVVEPGVVVFNTSGTGNNTLNIFDDGVGDLSFSTSSTAKPTAIKGGPVHEIVYNAGPGSDTFNYSMVNNAPLTEDMTVLVHLPPMGNKGFTATFGTPPKPPVLGSPGTPGTGPVAAKPVDVAGRLDIRIVGSPFKDNATLNYAGKVTGNLRASYVDPVQTGGPRAAGKNGDKIKFTMDILRDSTGTVFAKERGGVGNDSLQLAIRQRPRSPRVHITGLLDGGGGLNSGASSFPPTREFNIQS